MDAVAGAALVRQTEPSLLCTSFLLLVAMRRGFCLRVGGSSTAVAGRAVALMLPHGVLRFLPELNARSSSLHSLAVLEALKISPSLALLTCLDIDAGPWLTADVASALAEACPRLSKLVLNGNASPNAATEFGVLQLYAAVGRGLRSLHLRRLMQWRPVLLHGLRLCTGLEELEVDIQSSDHPFEGERWTPARQPLGVVSTGYTYSCCYTTRLNLQQRTCCPRFVK